MVAATALATPHPAPMSPPRNWRLHSRASRVQWLVKELQVVDTGATDVWGDLEEALQRRKLSPEELLALERRTHPLTCERDHIDPIIYSALEIRAQVNRGERPAPEQVVGIFWAKGDGVFWTRQTRTWDLPSLTGVYAHRFTFKYIYSAWTTFPLVVKTQRRGRNAEGSASDKWMGNILQMRKEAVPFLESLGIPKPRSKAEWSYIFKEMGTFLAAKNFIVNCPLPVMELPVAPVHDSKEALRFRAVCDERITLPLSSLRAFDSVYSKLVAGLSKSSMVEIKVNWRCNVVHDWVEPVPQEAAGALYDRLGSQDLITQLGCSPPLGASGPGGGAAKESDPKAKILAGADTTLRTPDQGTRRYPPITTATVTAVAGKKYINKHFPCPASAHGKWWARRSSRPPGATCAGICKGFWKASRGGTRLLQITGWHKDKATCLQLVMDEPPEQLYNQWIRDRMEFYKRVEPTEPSRDERQAPRACDSALRMAWGMSPLPCGRSS